MIEMVDKFENGYTWVRGSLVLTSLVSYSSTPENFYITYQGLGGRNHRTAGRRL